MTTLESAPERVLASPAASGELNMPRYRPTPSKRAVLVQLRQRPMTVSELARVLAIDKAAVHRHLADLTKEGMVERVPSPRKWVYYSLTDPGKWALGVMDPPGKKPDSAS